MPSAEIAYVFRHALLREAAYQLQMPADRARLHGVALDLLEELVAGEQAGAYAGEMADHARAAAEGSGADRAGLGARECRHLRAAAEFAAARFRHDDGARLWMRLAGHASTPDEKRSGCVRSAGSALRNAGRLDDATGRFREAIDLAVRWGGTPEELAARGSLFFVDLLVGRLDGVEGGIRASIDRAHAAGLAGEVRYFRDLLGCHLKDTGRPDEAEREFRRALADLRAAGGGAVGEEAKLLHQLASAALLFKRVEEAEALYTEALELWRRSGNRQSYGAELAHVGWANFEQKKIDLAALQLEEALAIARETGDRMNEGYVEGSLGAVWLMRGDLGRADRCFAASTAMLRETGDRRLLGVMLRDWSEVRVKEGRLEEALALLAEAIGIHREVRDRVSYGWGRGLEAIVLSLMGRAAESAAKMGEARRVLDKAFDAPYLKELEERYGAAAKS